MFRLIINSNGKAGKKIKVLSVQPSLGKTTIYKVLEQYFKEKHV